MNMEKVHNYVETLNTKGCVTIDEGSAKENFTLLNRIADFVKKIEVTISNNKYFITLL